MNLLCHRGIWKSTSEKNSLEALSLAIQNNYGIETDIRDFNGEIVISHDPPHNENYLLLKDFLRIYKKSIYSPCLALNIKSDGLSSILLNILKEFKINNYFVFDMSIPDTLSYIKLKMNVATRLSEYEAIGKINDLGEFVWLDAFESEWYSVNLISDLLKQGKKVAIVSPELHKREYKTLWSTIKPFFPNDNLYLCTDLVFEARDFLWQQR